MHNFSLHKLFEKVNLFLKVSLKIFAGLCNTGAGREVHMNLMPPPRPKLTIFSCFVSSGGFC